MKSPDKGIEPAGMENQDPFSDELVNELKSLTRLLIDSEEGLSIEASVRYRCLQPLTRLVHQEEWQLTSVLLPERLDDT